MSAPDDDAAPHVDPHVQVVRGAPDEVELAALVAGLVAAASGHEPLADDAEARARAARARWAAPGRLRGGVGPARGVDAWRWSLHP
ncbi:acyl-CoA carboxylase epsilon subunit [Cellulomonas sp. B6]|uniref:acyl-CoA carboxylase epsilon subunit n=1 Tax=Cellulomonas sp. B6 TaxID=1295626 RepID=UPI00073CC9E8|nr:acyl-CoA carboxylase epsilon subunit [Cellulomonas sp. B6]KSW28409.1 hypothetical protein ATM99_11685 [Cellulomonas sp. B6]